MMSASIFPLISFVLISTFTPGPSNVSSASMGVLYGYRMTLKFLLGLAAGAFVMFLISALVATTFLTLIPAVDPALRWIGAAYILYLAVMILRASYHDAPTGMKPMGFAQGLLLQLLNPKMIVYGLTLFSVFLAPIADNLILLFLAAALLTATAFCATSVWALFGSLMNRFLRQPRIALVVNIVLALFLVYAAVEIAGVL